MSCEIWTEAISALADGEASPVDRPLLEAHLRRCPSCRRYRDAASAGRPWRDRPVGAAESTGLAAKVVREAARADRDRWPRGARLLLGVLAAQILVLALPSLVGSADGMTAHDGRHLGAFSAAYAFGLVGVCRRPARARTMLVVGQVLILALVLASVIDIADRSISPAGELRHLPDALSVAVLWRLCEGRWPTASSMATLQSRLRATRGRFRRRPVAGAGHRRRPLNVARTVAVAVGLAGLGIVATACAGDGGFETEAADEVEEADYSYVIPAGAGEAFDAGEPLEILPSRLEVSVGDVIEIRNDDDRGHLVGPFFVGADETIRHRFRSPGELKGNCTVHPDGEIVVVVT